MGTKHSMKQLYTPGVSRYYIYIRRLGETQRFTAYLCDMLAGASFQESIWTDKVNISYDPAPDECH